MSNCVSKLDEFLFHDRRAVTLKSLLPLKAMEFIHTTGFIIK